MYSPEVLEKTVILYALYKFKISMTNEQIHIIFVENDIMDYFSYTQQLLRLIDDAYIAKITIENEERYGITQKGIDFVEMSLGEIPSAIKEKINLAVDKILKTYDKLTDIRTSITPLSENRFITKCGIYERNIPLIELNLTTGSRRHAEKLEKSFRKNYNSIYKEVFQLFT